MRNKTGQYNGTYDIVSKMAFPIVKLLSALLDALESINPNANGLSFNQQQAFAFLQTNNQVCFLDIPPLDSTLTTILPRKKVITR